MSAAALREARRLLLSEHYGILATQSAALPGYPFGSVVPYVVDLDGQLLIYISELAQHTRNLRRDPKHSLTIRDSTVQSDVQASGRLTWIADASLLPEAEQLRIRKRFFRQLPESRTYEQTHDFAFWKLILVRARFIGGFGAIHWLEAENLLQPNPFSAQEEQEAIEHMNEDHQRAQRHYLSLLFGVNVEETTPVEMVALDGEGFVLHCQGNRYRGFFEEPVETMQGAREALVRLARAQLPASGSASH